MIYRLSSIADDHCDMLTSILPIAYLLATAAPEPAAMVPASAPVAQEPAVMAPASEPTAPASVPAAPATGGESLADQDAVPGAGLRRLEEAQRAYDELRLDQARIALDRALRDPSNSRQQLVSIYRLKGVVEASMGQPIAAKRAFSQMLVLAPAAVLSDDLSPKLSKAFDSARASLPGERGVLVESAAPAEVLMGQDAELPIRVNDTLGLVEQIAVRYRVADGEPRELVLTRAERGLLRLAAAELPTRPEPYLIALEASAQNAFGAELARLDPKDPTAQVSVVAEFSSEPIPWYQEWWVWAGLAGGVVVASATAGVLVWTLAPPDTSPRDIGIAIE